MSKIFFKNLALTILIIFAFKKRLEIAKKFNDKAAERRAHCNLGNAHIFLGEFHKAIENYKYVVV